MFKDRNVVMINGDEIRPFHPKAEEIAKIYPELYNQITDQETITWTTRLFEELRQEGYNIIFEGTMRNNRIADESITQLRDELGYTVVVRGLSVCGLESRISILERYECQVKEKGYGRMVLPTQHHRTYVGMPNTIEYIESTGKYDVLEIFQRGKETHSPVLIYAVCNPRTEKEAVAKLEGRDYISLKTQKNGYNSGLQAILNGREKNHAKVLPTCPERLKKIKKLLTIRKEQLINKLQTETDKNERKSLEHMLSQLEEETRQILELLNMGQKEKSKQLVQVKKKEIDSATFNEPNTDDDNAR